MTEDYYWDIDIVNATKMGGYLTKKEQELIDTCLGNYHTNIICLDVGRGSGRFSIPLFKKGFKIVTLDYDPLPLQKLREKEERILLIRADAQQLPFRDGIFDGILAIEIIDYFPNKSHFVEELNRVLKYEGILLINMGNKNSYKRVIRSLIRTRECDRKLYRFSYKGQIGELHKYGFTIQKAWGYNWLPANRASNSKLLLMYSFIEGVLNLSSFPSISPWVFIEAKKGVDK